MTLTAIMPAPPWIEVGLLPRQSFEEPVERIQITSSGSVDD
jgi:hypothetical protein